MDPGPSRLPAVQCLDEITPCQPQAGQPIYSNVEIHGSQFFDICGGFHHHTEKTDPMDRLQQYISDGAFYDSNARFPPPRCHPGTRIEVLNMITEWIDDPYPHQNIMWLNGPAGAGKSAIAQTIAESYKDSRLAASFFFLRNTPDRGVADRLFPTLAWQISTSIPETRQYIESALKKEPLLYSKSIDIQFDQLIVEVFKNLLRDEPDLRPKRFLVIIDGVDECAPEQDQKLLLALITDALACTRFPLRFLICSRAEAHIKETFNAEKTDVTRAVVLDERFAPDNDIRRYFEDEFSRIFTERNISPHPSDANVHHMISKASGQFIYASTVIKFIDDNDHHPREQLDIVLKLRPVDSSSPYAQLDQLYMQILSQQPDVKFLKDVFVLIIALGVPRFEFICRRLRISGEKLRLKLRRMHSLLYISNSFLTTYHRSLHDFFRDKERAGQYYIYPVRVALVRSPLNSRRNLFVFSIIGGMMTVITVGVILAVLVIKASKLSQGLAIGLPLGGLAVAIVLPGLIIAMTRARNFRPLEPTTTPDAEQQAIENIPPYSSSNETLNISCC